MRLLERLPQQILAQNPKWLVGYSDITALHLWAYSQGVASIHGPMVAGLGKHKLDNSLDELVQTLGGRPPTLKVRNPSGNSARGRLIGGNLSLLAAMRATRWWPPLRGCVLFIEEIGEPLYRIDRMLQTLVLAGGLEEVEAVVLGQFTRCGMGQGGPKAAEELVRETLRTLKGPVTTGASAGHGTPNFSFVHGGMYEVHGQLCRYVGEPPAKTPRKAPTVKNSKTSTARELIHTAITAGICSAIQLVISRQGEVVYNEAAGARAFGSCPIQRDAHFDIASVTKAVSTAVLAHLAVQTGLVELESRCPLELSSAQPTLRDLLRHSSGLPAHIEVFREARLTDAPKDFADRAFAAVNAIEAGPCYSDVGYIALGRWLEELFGTDLRSLFAAKIAQPLGIQTCFGPLSSAIATEFSSFHGEFLDGIVHDENAQVLGAAAGHAGLFSSAQDLDLILRSLMGFGPSILDAASVQRMWDYAERPEGGTYTLGWDTPSGTRSNAGALMSRSATVGHLGFTGTSVWIDRDAELAVTLLTNRVHPTRENAGIRWLRPAIQDAAFREFS
ncbi:MAG: CubicO group peptidase (beta-lactamase class C family) [Bradymonadia bacterium]|jgi:CubicO group peptidase (beta-lactamase class C family)